MTPITDTRILELLASKICHDLISPVGAISNGIEILDELGEDPDGEVLDLISHSAGQAAAKLKAMRLAYGLGGADPSVLPKDVYKAFDDYLEREERFSHEWDPFSIEMSAIGAPKILMCTLMLAFETLPKGGKIGVTQESPDTILVRAEGQNAHLRDGVLYALHLKTDVENLEPIHVHAYVTGLLARNYGFSIEIDDQSTEFISLRLKLSDVS